MGDAPAVHVEEGDGQEGGGLLEDRGPAPAASSRGDAGREALRTWLEHVLAGGEGLPRPITPVHPEPSEWPPALAIVAAAAACARGDDGAYHGYATRVRQSLFARSGEGTSTAEHVGALALTALHGRAFGADTAALAATSSLARQADPGVRRAAHLWAAELHLDRGELWRARRALLALPGEGGASAPPGAADLLAFLAALEGQVAEAESLRSTLETRPRRRQTAGMEQVARLTDVLVLAQQGAEARARERLAGLDVTASSHAARIVATALHAGLAARVGARADRALSHHPLAVRTLVALGVLEVTDEEGHRGIIGGPAEHALRRARLALETGAPGVALDAASPWVSVPSASSAHPRTNAELMVITSIAHAAEGDTERALRRLSSALSLSARGRMWAPVMSHSQRLVPLLQSFVVAGDPNVGIALSLLDQLRPAELPALVEALTPQERAALVLLPTLMSNTEMAAALHVSVNTVKSHLKSVYRKLGVGRRRDAVVRARQLALLE